MFLVGRVGELLVVCDAHLFILQIHINGFGFIWHGEMMLLFSVLCGIGRLSTW
jgi:hypothetical protein